MQDATSPLNALGAFASRMRIEDCPAAVAEKARALLLYGLAVGVSSARAPVLRRVAAALRREYGQAPGECTWLADGGKSAAGAAAFCNGALLHVRIQDDAHPAGHMGTVVLPAALAMAEAQGCGGADLMAAVIAGYEVALRIGRDHADDMSDRGFRTTPIYGVFGAAAACARLLALDPEHTMHALATVTHCAGGLREFASAGTDEYPFQAGYAARNGLTSALLAAEGVTGTPSALTGPAGLFAAFADRTKDYAARLLEGLGKDYELERVTYKPYPGGQYQRAVIRGFAALREQAPQTEIETAAIHMHPFEARFLGLDYSGPFSAYTQAFFSAQFCAALAWLHGTVSFAALNRFDDEAVLDLLTRIRIVGDDTCERYKPKIRISLRGGGVLDWSEPPGDEVYTLTWQIALDMTNQLCAEVGVPQAQADALVDAVVAADSTDSIRPLVHAATAIAQAAREIGTELGGEHRRR